MLVSTQQPGKSLKADRQSALDHPLAVAIDRHSQTLVVSCPPFHDVPCAPVSDFLSVVSFWAYILHHSTTCLTVWMSVVFCWCQSILPATGYCLFTSTSSKTSFKKYLDLQPGIIIRHTFMWPSTPTNCKIYLPHDPRATQHDPPPPPAS